jgi:predicted deacylase
MLTERHPLLQSSIGQQRELVSFRFGEPGARPKIYIQASLHAEELPGMLVAHHLKSMLQTMEAAGQLLGEVVLVPVANPIGLSQRLDRKAMGRFELNTSENFNRNYPVLADAIWDDVFSVLTPDAPSNALMVRQAVADYLKKWGPSTELESLRKTLLSLAHDADVVLDLHCDCESVMHLYSEAACWPALEPLARLLQCQAVLLAKDSGGSPFDECLSGLWWQLSDKCRAQGLNVSVPQACASATVELRGEADVSHALALQDAQAILAYLIQLKAVDGNATALPEASYKATPLAGSQTLYAPTPGVLVFLAEPGQWLNTQDTVAEVIDPVSGTVHAVQSGVEGVFYARVRERYVHAGGEIGKVAGATPFRKGPLLGF